MNVVLGRVVPVLFALLLLGAGLLHNAQLSDWLFRGSMLIILSVSWNLMANAGLISLGHSGFWGIGSYIAIMAANTFHLPLITGIAVAAMAGALVGAGLAVVTGRLRGLFFAISTLALSEGLRIVCVMLPGVTVGAQGLYLLPDLRGSSAALFLSGAAVTIVAIGATVYLARTPFHYACRTMRNNESAAQMLGIDPRRTRMAILAISAAMAASAGALSSWYGGYLDPDVGFDLHITIEAQIAPILGCMYTVAGPVIGAIEIQALSKLTRIGLAATAGVSQLVYGLVLVIGVLFMPRGLYGLWLDRVASRRVAEGAGP